MPESDEDLVDRLFGSIETEETEQYSGWEADVEGAPIPRDDY